MEVSMAIIPTLKGEAAVSLTETIKSSKITSYSHDSKLEAERYIKHLIEKLCKMHKAV